MNPFDLSSGNQKDCKWLKCWWGPNMPNKYKFEEKLGVGDLRNLPSGSFCKKHDKNFFQKDHYTIKHYALTWCITIKEIIVYLMLIVCYGWDIHTVCFWLDRITRWTRKLCLWGSCTESLTWTQMSGRTECSPVWWDRRVQVSPTIKHVLTLYSLMKPRGITQYIPDDALRHHLVTTR